MDILFHPIGYIHSPYTKKEDTPKQGREAGQAEGEIILDEAFAEGLADMKPGQQYEIFFYFHQSQDYAMTVRIRGTGPWTGLFSTRSPHRPNGIGLSVVTIIAVEGCHIRFTGVDMLDGTPILDIKPYISGR